MTVTVVETRDIALCHGLRRAVFIVEQGVSVEREVDGHDEAARHLVALRDGMAIGTARLLTEGAYGKIGRVCVLAEARGTGAGVALIRAAVGVFRAVPGVTKVKLGSQTHALGFYAGLGFEPVGEVYVDAGIDHQDMVLALG